MLLTALGVNGPYPAPNGACSAYLLECGDTRLLLDCGTGALALLFARVSPDSLSAVVLSHLHFDHMSDMLPLRYALQFSGRETPLPVYAPEEPAPVRALLEDARFALHPCRDFELGALSVRFEKAVHPVPGHCVSISDGKKRLVYTGDTNENPALLPFAQDCDLLLGDSGLPESAWHEGAPHLSALRCGRLARDCGAKALLLTHLPPYCRAEALLCEARAAFPEAALAESGARYFV